MAEEAAREEERSSKRMAILAAARRVFLEEGYRASMDRIAAEAGVAKQTMYRHFGSKDELFAAMVQHNADRSSVALDLGHSLRQALLVFAEAALARILAPEALAFYRVAVAEAPRFPALAQAIFVAGSERMLSRLAARLDRAIAAGELRPGDSRMMAEMFVGMIDGQRRSRRLLHVAVDREMPSERWAEAVVDAFLRAFGRREF